MLVEGVVGAILEGLSGIDVSGLYDLRQHPLEKQRSHHLGSVVLLATQAEQVQRRFPLTRNEPGASFYKGRACTRQ